MRSGKTLVLGQKSSTANTVEAGFSLPRASTTTTTGGSGGGNDPQETPEKPLSTYDKTVVEAVVEARWKTHSADHFHHNPGSLEGPGVGKVGSASAVSRASEDFEIELPWPNRTGNRAVRHGGGSHYLSREALAYRDAVRRALERRRLADRKLVGPYQLHIVLEPPDARARDGDNLEKVLMDALVRAGLLADDSNKVIPRLSREWTAPNKPGRILVIGKGI